ncbi:MAG: Gfo/Idh/MocA family oxidoreductase [Gaiellaceae bacterium]
MVLVGVGLIGGERLRALESLAEAGHDVDVVGVLDPAHPELAAASRFEPKLCSTLADVIAADPDWTFVATPHDVAVEYVPSLLQAGLQVLVEKPLGRTSVEAKMLANTRIDADQLRVGHNYRFFRGIEALLDDVEAGTFGELVSLNLVLGHGGSPGMEEGWKLDPQRAGGGALIDPGIHLLDLVRLVARAEVSVVGGSAWGGFWGTGIEEECHLLLRAASIPLISLEVSLVRWRSTFRMEVHGTEGYGLVEGRGRSYGVQTYRRGERWGWRSAPSQAESEQLVMESDGADVFQRELAALLFPTGSQRVHVCTADEAIENMELLDACRRSCAVEVGGGDS